MRHRVPPGGGRGRPPRAGAEVQLCAPIGAIGERHIQGSTPARVTPIVYTARPRTCDSARCPRYSLPGRLNMSSNPTRLKIRAAQNEKQAHIARLGQEILRKANLPCRLGFAENDTGAEARHMRLKNGRCYVVINSRADICVPEHIILHEAAHHQGSSGEQSHGREWAERLCLLYQKTGIPLPSSTRFESFAKLCNIRIRRPARRFRSAG